MQTRYDWLFIITWTAIFAAVIVAVVVAFWLVQRVFLAVYPLIQPHAGALLYGLLAVSCTGLFVAAVREERRR